MRGWWQDLSDLVLPALCAGCGRSRTSLCARCSAALCGAVPGRVRPRAEPPGLPVVYAAAPYQDAVRAVLLAHKERGALGLAGPLGLALAGAVRRGLSGPAPQRLTAVVPQPCPGTVGLVPVPSAARAVRARGHDPMRRIAYAAAAELRRAGVSARVLAVLRQRRAMADQAGLDARERLVNVTGALEVAAGAGGLVREVGRIVVVDDLMTTGASLSEASRALRALSHPVSGNEEVGDARERRATGSRMAGPDEVLGAVIAASPDSFEINRK
ncbi:ComF family protein [Streptomyces sp. NPDC016845]|uniref:ComF family protein n=1 Tax=Streptomyces sp. NPDC016845 TaxID=3364972 RepID=UPI00378C8B05